MISASRMCYAHGMKTNPEKRYVNVGYRMNNKAQIFPDPNEMQIEYSVDPWANAPDGYALFVDGDETEYWIPKADIEQTLAPWA